MFSINEFSVISLLAILLDATIKGLILVVLAWGVSRVLGKVSAAGRHTLWSITVVALLTLPFLSAALPQWQIPVLPEWAQYKPAEKENNATPAETPQQPEFVRNETKMPREGANVAAIASQLDESELSALAEQDTISDSENDISLPSPSPEILATGAQTSLAETPPERVVQAWPAWVILVWAGGAGVVLLPLLLGSFIAWRCVQRATPVTDAAWLEMLANMIASLQLYRGVQLRRSGGEDIPAVFGVLRPTILIPAGADAWPDQRRCVVLLHELAHVKRRDCLTQLLAQFACVVYWFNPLAWLVSRQLRIERERACDDLVLSAGQRPSEYADHLLEMVRTLRSRACPSFAAVAMAKKSNFEHRLLAILDAARPRKAFTKAATTIAFFTAVAILLPLAMLRVTPKTPDVEEIQALLSPKEHMEQSDKAQELYGTPTKEIDDEDNVILRGIVKTSDGSSLPKDAQINIRSEYAHSASFSTMAVNSNGTFEGKVTCGEISIVATAKNFAPSETVFRSAKPGEVIADINLTLVKGYDAKVKVVDEQGKGLAGFALQVVRIQDGFWLNSASTFQADNDGLVTIHNLSPPGKVKLTTQTKGYQKTEWSTELKPDTTTQWTIRKATPIHGTLTKAATGEPLAEAKLYLAHEGGSYSAQDIRITPLPQDLLATTDEQGRFVLDTFTDGLMYDIWIDAGERGVQLLRSISTNNPELSITFDPVILRGTIIGDLASLKKQNDAPMVHISNGVMFDKCNYNTSFDVPVEPSPKGGEFRAANIVPGRVTLYAGDTTRTLNVSQGANDVVVDLNEKKQDFDHREVIVRLLPPEGWPKPTGEIRTDYLPPDELGYKYRKSTLVEGEAKVDVVLPKDKSGKMLCEAITLPGYRFNNRSEIEVPHGDTPMVLEIPVEPAGSVFGKVLLPDGATAWQFYASLITIKKSDVEPSLTMIQSVSGLQGKFLISGIPLGGTYRLLVSDSRIDNNAAIISEEFTLDKDHPTRELNLRFMDGKTIEAIVLGPDNKPRPGVSVSLNFNTEWSYGGGGAPRQTDTEGRVAWQNVNFDLPATYSLSVHPTLNTQGQIVPIDAAKLPMTVRLEKGLSASGVVIDDVTGQPIPDLQLQLNPPYQAYKQGVYTQPIPFITDAQGRFQLDNLASYQYTVHSDDVVPKNVQFIEKKDGSYSYQRGPETKDTTIQAGQADQELRVKIRPGSSVQPLPETQSTPATQPSAQPTTQPAGEGKQPSRETASDEKSKDEYVTRVYDIHSLLEPISVDGGPALPEMIRSVMRTEAKRTAAEKNRDTTVEAEVVNKDGMVTRVYDVRDLLVIVPEIENSPSASLPWDDGLSDKSLFKEQDPKEQEKTRSMLRKMLLQTIETSYSEKCWSPKPGGGTANIEKGNLIVTQTPKCHENILQLLERLRSTQGLQISTEARFVYLPKDVGEKMQAWLLDQKLYDKKMSKDGVNAVALTSEQADAFQKTFQKYKSVRELTAPKITMFNGQPAYVSILTNKAILFPKPGSKETVVKNFDEGSALYIDGTVNHERTGVTMTVKPVSTHLVSVDKEVTYDINKTDITFSSPDNYVFLIPIPSQRWKAQGVKSRKGPGGQPVYEVVSQKIPGATQQLWLMVKPHIILPESTLPEASSKESQETTSSDLPVNQSTATTQPADVADVLASLKAELVTASKEYPELAGVKDVQTRGDGAAEWELNYIHNCKDWGQRGYEDTGDHAAAIVFRVMTEDHYRKILQTREMQAAMYTWPNLNMVGWATVHVGKNPSAGVSQKVGTILREHLGMMYALDKSASQATSQPAATQHVTRTRYPLSESEENKAVIEKLNTQMAKFELKHVEFPKAIDMLRQSEDILFHVSWGSLQVDNPEIRNAVVNLNLAECTVAEALRILLDAAAGKDVLGFAAEDGVVTIDTMEKISSMTYPQVYDIRDLTTPTPANQNAPWVTCLIQDKNKRDALTQEKLTALFIQFIRKAIVDTAEHDGWYPDGNGQINELSGNLVVTQTQKNHRELAILLSSLRKTPSKQMYLPRKIIEPRVSDMDQLCGWLPVTLGWNGQKVFIPGPIYWPKEGRRTSECRDWQRNGDTRSMQFADSHGREWRAKTLGLSMPEITVHRPDGTLLATGIVMENNVPSYWEIYDATGKKIVFKAICREDKTKDGNSTGRWNVGVFYTYDPDGTEHEWQLNGRGVVHAEKVTLSNGKRYYAAYAVPYESFYGGEEYSSKQSKASELSNVRTVADFMLRNAQAGNMEVVKRLVQPDSPLAKQMNDLSTILKGNSFSLSDHNVSMYGGNQATLIAEKRVDANAEYWTLDMKQTDDGHWLATEMKNNTRQIGEFYVMGKVKRPGAYCLTRGDVTVKMAIASAEMDTGKDRPRTAMLIRRIPDNKEDRIPLDLDGILTGKTSDVFLKPNDILVIGMNLVSTRKQLPIRTTLPKGVRVDQTLSKKKQNDQPAVKATQPAAQPGENEKQELPKRTAFTFNSKANLSITSEYNIQNPTIPFFTSIGNTPAKEHLVIPAERTSWTIALIGGNHLGELRKLVPELNRKNLPDFPDLWLNDNTTDADLAEVAKIKELKCLDLWPCENVTDTGVAYIGTMKQLEELSLPSSLTDKGLEQISKLTNLKSLYLASCKKITDAGLANITRLPNLRSIDLQDCEGVTDAGMAHLAKCKQLEAISLFNTDTITDEGLRQLASLPNVSSLSLDGCCRITDQGVAYLAVMKKLGSVSFEGGITDTGLKHLAGLSKLYRLELGRDSTISPELVKTLRVKNPHLTITRKVVLPDQIFTFQAPLTFGKTIDVNQTTVVGRYYDEKLNEEGKWIRETDKPSFVAQFQVKNVRIDKAWFSEDLSAVIGPLGLYVDVTWDATVRLLDEKGNELAKTTSTIDNDAYYKTDSRTIKIPLGKWQGDIKKAVKFELSVRAKPNVYKLSSPETTPHILLPAIRISSATTTQPAATSANPTQDVADPEPALEKGVKVTGVVLQPNGKPAAYAYVALTDRNNHGIISLNDNSDGHFFRVERTSKDGRFTYTATGEPGKIVAYHESGFADVDLLEVKQTGKIPLDAWGHVEGTLMIGDKPGVDEPVYLKRSLPDGRFETRMSFTANTKTDKNGCFRFDRVPPGTVQVGRIRSQGDTMSQMNIQRAVISRIVKVKSRKTSAIKLGGTGRPIVGRLLAPVDYKGKVNWVQGFCNFRTKDSLLQPPVPPNSEAMSSSQKQAWLEEWKQTEEGKAFQKKYAKAQNKLRHFDLYLNPDGSFRVEDVPAGTYELYGMLFQPSEDTSLGSVIGEMRYEFTVPEISGGRSDEPLDIGTYEFKSGKKKTASRSMEPLAIKQSTIQAAGRDKPAQVQMSKDRNQIDTGAGNAFVLR